MTLQDLENLDLKKATIPELEEAIRTATRSLNKRYEHVKHTKNAYQGAVNYIDRTGGKFALSHKNIFKPSQGATPQQYRASLQKEVARAQGFQKSQGSRVQSARQIRKDLLENMFGGDKRLKKVFESLPTATKNDLISEFWSGWHKFVESNQYHYEYTNESNDHMSDSMLREYRESFFNSVRSEELQNQLQKSLKERRQREDEEFQKDIESEINGTDWGDMFT